MRPESRMDDRLERLLDEELQAAVHTRPVDLRASVLQAIDEGRGRRDEGRGTWAVPRWAFAALATASMLVLAIVLVWRGNAGPGAERVAAHRPPLASTTLAAGTLVEPVAAPAARPAPASLRRTSRFAAWDEERVAVDASASNEPYLPGAPAGGLGDPLRPLPSTPPTTFAPITAAPSVSEFARPVTDFPADNPAPAPPSGGEPGQSGGTRR